MNCLINELSETADFVQEKLDACPERRMDICEEYILKNEKRPYPCIFLNIGQDPLERKDFVIPGNKSAEEKLIDKLNGLLIPLKLNNPVAPYLSLGVGPGSMIASFGLELDAALDYTPRGHKSAEEIIRNGMPDPEKSGIMPKIKEEIDAILAFTSPFYKIEKPDMQGPFNIAHAVLGTEAFILPYTEPEKYAEVMDIITRFYIATDRMLVKWIGKDRAIRFPRRRKIIAECSCNLVSSQFYREFVLPYDRQICDYYGESCIHPCSGPHVFYATLENLPNLTYTEAGEMLTKMAAGSIKVEDALKAIGKQNIILNIGQELPENREYEFIQKDLDLAKSNNRLLFGYTGMHFREKDIPKILSIHDRLDEYWEKNIYFN